jgi:hypothetical protein
MLAAKKASTNDARRLQISLIDSDSKTIEETRFDMQ